MGWCFFKGPQLTKEPSGPSSRIHHIQQQELRSHARGGSRGASSRQRPLACQDRAWQTLREDLDKTKKDHENRKPRRRTWNQRHGGPSGRRDHIIMAYKSRLTSGPNAVSVSQHLDSNKSVHQPGLTHLQATKHPNSNIEPHIHPPKQDLFFGLHSV